MAIEKNYYTIDPEGKLHCMKCGIPLIKGKAKFMYLDGAEEKQIWSMKDYIDSVIRGDRVGDLEHELAREEIEHSIIARLADDVRVGAGNDGISVEAIRSIQY